jgi:hypothetical protein
MTRSVVRRSISFEEQDIQTVNRVAQLVGGFSAALRLIIRQWAQYESEIADQRVSITEAGKAALAEEKESIDLG